MLEEVTKVLLQSDGEKKRRREGKIERDWISEEKRSLEKREDK